jgi:hypothetical protein
MMRNKLLCVVLALFFVGSVSFAGKVDITNNGTFYLYSFFWDNARFDGNDTLAVEDGDQFFYMHADVGIKADFGGGITSQVTVGGWGTFGQHPITGMGEACGTPGHDVGVREAFIDFANLFDAPINMRAGKMHVLYGNQFFDGGEDGIMGFKFYGQTDVIDYSLDWYRLEENGGCFAVGNPLIGVVDDDLDLLGGYFTIKFMEGAIRVPLYVWYRTQSYTVEDTVPYDVKDEPMWLGGRLEVGPLAGVYVAGEFTQMMGSYSNATTIDYKGMHYSGKLAYKSPTMPLMVGGGYYYFSGDELDTLGMPVEPTECGTYESPFWGPYTNDFYKYWPGFGPAHSLRTTYGFSLMLPGYPEEYFITNMSVINGYIGYHNPLVTLRFDYWKYAKDQVMAGVETDMGQEFSVLATYMYQKRIVLGFTGGYWMPGDYFGTDPDAMLGGSIFTYITY